LGEVEDSDRIANIDDRYHDLKKIYGKTFVNKLQSSKLFLVGAGALGCEFLKFFALTGLGSVGDGKV